MEYRLIKYKLPTFDSTVFTGGTGVNEVPYPHARINFIDLL